MCFTSTSLSISKNCPIITFKHIFDNIRSARIININLTDRPVKSHIKGKLLWRLITAWFNQENFTNFVVNFYCNFMTILHFFCAHRSASNDDLNCLRLFIRIRLILFARWHTNARLLGTHINARLLGTNFHVRNI